MATDITSPSAPPRPQPPERRRRRRLFHRVPPALVLLLLAGALQSIAWDLSLPAFQGPDEDSHFAYVQHFAETGKFPSSTAGPASNSTEVQDALTQLNLFPLKGDLGARPAWSSADLAFWHQLERQMPTGSRANGSGPDPVAKNPPLYYVLMAAPYRLAVWLPLLKRLFVLRLFNALFYLATIALTWMIAGEVFGASRWKQTLAAGAVALEPQLAFMSAVINADSLLIALTTGVLLACLRLVTRGPTMARVLTASLLAAAAILTHGRGLVTLPVLGVALVVAALRHRPRAGEVLARGAAAVSTVAAALAAYLVLQKAAGGGALYGGEIGTYNTGAQFNIRQFLSSIYQFYFPKLPSLQPRIGPSYGYRQVFIETFYGTFGWLEVTFKTRVYDALQVASAIGLLSFYTACVARWRTLLRSWHVVVVMLALLFTTIFFLHYVSYRALLGNGATDPLIVGRYLLPMVSLFGMAIAFTVGSLPRRAGPLVGAALLAVGVLLSLTGIGMTMARFYA